MQQKAGLLIAAATAAAIVAFAAERAAAQSFSLDPPSSSLPAVAATAGDLLTPSGPLPAAPPPAMGISAAALGLLPGDVIDALTYGNDAPFGAGALFFSVTRTAVGIAGPPGDVTFEQTTHPSPEASSDIFSAGVLDPACPLGPGVNTQVVDGDGVATAGFCYPGASVGLAEVVLPPVVDNIDAFDWGFPGVGYLGGFGLSLAPGSPTLAGANPLLPGGAGPGDVIVALVTPAPSLFVFAPAPTLGLIGGLPGCAPPVCDDIDALSVSFPGGGTVAFSISPGSPSIGACGYSTADVLGALAPPIPPCFPPAMPAGALGLAVPDDLNALEATMNPCPVVPPTADVPDGDGLGGCDNCPAVFNPAQEDSDGDALGDACDLCTDTEGDGFGNPGFPANACATDLCPFTPGPNGDGDGDGDGDICDNCPLVPNPAQTDSDFDGAGNACDPCPNVFGALPAPFDLGTLKKAQLGYKNNGPGSGDDSVKTGAAFTTGTAFDPDSTDSVFVTLTNTATGATLSSTSMPAPGFWTQPNPAKLSWKYSDTGPPGIKASIKESPAGSTTYKWKVGVKSASVPGPQITPATDDIRVTLEIGSPANLCFEGTLPTCTTKPLKKDSCKP